MPFRLCLALLTMSFATAFDPTAWLDGACGRPRGRGVIVVATRFMQGQGQFPALVGARLEQILTVTIPSMAAQTDRCFFWVVATDPALPAGPRKRLEDALAVMPHARLVDSTEPITIGAPRIAQLLAKRAFGAGPWRGVKELTVVTLDADDALHAAYVRYLNDWRLAAPQLTPERNYAYACASRAMKWSGSVDGRHGFSNENHDGEKPCGFRIFNPTSIRIDFELTEIESSEVWWGAPKPVVDFHTGEKSGHKGCLNSGLAMAQRVAPGGFFESCEPRPCHFKHPELREKLPVEVVVVKRGGRPITSSPVLRVRSITSTGGRGGGKIHGQNATRSGAQQVDAAHLKAAFGVDGAALEKLTTYLKAHEADVAREMLGHRNATGCSDVYMGSCARDETLAWARSVLGELPAFDATAWLDGGACGRARPGRRTLVVTRFNQGQGRFPALVDARLEQLLAVTAPSMRAQSDTCFLWLVATDPALPAAPRRRLEQALARLPHARLVDADEQLTPNRPRAARDVARRAFGLADWRSVDEVTVVNVDADDGLHRDYVRALHAWRDGARSLTAERTYAHACAARSMSWTGVADGANAFMHERLSGDFKKTKKGCLMSGLAVAHRLEDGGRAPCAPAPCHFPHTELREHLDVFVVEPAKDDARMKHAPVLRVKSITTTGGGNFGELRHHRAVDGATLRASFGVDAEALVALAAYLAAHEVAIAREILGHRDASGCHESYVGSCERAGALERARAVVARAAA
ncbi:hypothetical protein SO694_00058278 [Aureococcus anophagefferens]|uniref:Glycosyl transferase 64 domain-containing protein n=1 Tax=Aureococcus anophagefferens TaxID=44056 RepID=A0ABR1FZD0_AURAN